MVKKLTYGEYLSPNYRPTVQQDMAKFKATIDRNIKIANSPLEDRDGIDVDLDIVPATAPNANAAGGASAGTNVLGNESVADAVKSLYVQPNLIQAKGYTEWLEAGGMAGAAQRQYDATVRAAETDYAKSKALYGRNAETLGRAGLTGSGYGDYLTGAGFAAMQGAKVTAADTRALTEAQQRSDYANYLMGVEQANAEAQAAADAQNRQTYAEYLSREGDAKEAIDAAIAQGLDDNAVRTYVQQRYGNEFDSYLDSWIANAHTYTDPLLAEQQAAELEAETEAENEKALARKQEALATFEKYAAERGGAYAEQMMAALGYNDQEIGDAKAIVQGLTSAEQGTILELEGLSLEQIPTSASIQNEITLGRMSPEEGEAFKERAMEKRVELLDKQYDNLSNEDAPDFISQVYELYNSGDIPREAFAKYASGLAAENVASIADDKTIKEPVVEIAAIISTIEDNDKVYGDIEDEILQSIANAAEIDVLPGAITIFNGRNNSEPVSLRYKFMQDDERQAVTNALGQGQPDEIKNYNGTLYQWIGGSNGQWNKIKGVRPADVGGKDNASLIYDLLLAKYK